MPSRVANGLPKWLAIPRHVLAPLRILGAKRWTLIVNASSLGDLLLFRGFLREARRQWPDQKIMLVCKRECACLVEDLVDRTVTVSWGKTNSSSLGERVRRMLAGMTLSSRKYSRILHPVYSTMGVAHDVCHTACSNVKIAFRGDFAAPDESCAVDAARIYTALVDVDANIHELDKTTVFAQIAGMAKVSGRKNVLPEYQVSEETKSRAAALIPGGSQIICVCPGARYKEKDWGSQERTEGGRFSKLIRGVASEGDFTFILLGGPDDISRGEKIKNACIGVKVHNLCGKTTIQESIAIIGSASLCVGNDTFGLHAAIVTNVPSVVIMGGGNFPRWVPWSDEKKHRMVTGKCAFQGCNWKCRYHGSQQYKCVRSVTVGDVMKEIDSLAQATQL